MSFVFNNKLPLYSWGVVDQFYIEDAGGLYQLQKNAGLLRVPLPENGAPRMYRYKRNDGESYITSQENVQLPLESTPCDAQLPWKYFLEGGALNTDTFGLTLHGEVYAMPARGWSWYTDASGRPPTLFRRMEKICKAAISEPIAFLSLADSTNLFVVTRSGLVYKIIPYTRQTDAPEQVTLPVGVSAKWLWGSYTSTGETLLVLTSNDNKTYIKTNGAGDWVALTGSVYRAATDSGTYVAEWPNANRPTLTVAAPDAGGTTATVTGIWATSKFTPGYSHLDGVTITNRGSGYTADPVVTFSAAPTYGNADNYTLKVFTDYINTHLRNGSIQAASNANWSEYWYRGSSSTAWQIFNGTSSANLVTAAIPYVGADAPENVISVSHFAGAHHYGEDYIISADGKMYKGGLRKGKYAVELFDEGPWQSIATSLRNVAAVKKDGSLWTWGWNGVAAGSFNQTLDEVLFGDSSDIGTTRTTPVQIASEAEWLSVFFIQDGGYAAIRKDAICRDIDQPMEYWPDWAYG